MVPRRSADPARTTSCPVDLHEPRPELCGPRRGTAHGLGGRPLEPDPLRECRLLQQQGAVDRLGQHLRRHPRRQLRRPGRRRAGQHRPASGFNIVPGTTVTLYSYNATTQQWSQTPTGGSGTRLVLSLASGSNAGGRLLPALHPQPGRHNKHRHEDRHADLRHLRQPARRRVPRQRHLDPGQQRDRVPRSASRQHPILGDLQLRGPALHRRLPPGTCPATASRGARS